MNKYFRERNPILGAINKVLEINNLLKSCREKFDMNLPQAALRDVNQALMIDEGNFLGHYLKSLCLAKLEDYAQALDEINIALNINPNDIDALNERGCLCQKNNDYGQAIMDYSRILELDENNPDALYNRGYVFLINEQFEAAAKDFKKIVENKPFDADAYNNLGLCYHLMGKTAQGLTYLHKSLELDPLSDAKHNINIIQEEKINKKKKI